MQQPVVKVSPEVCLPAIDDHESLPSNTSDLSDSGVSSFLCNETVCGDHSPGSALPHSRSPASTSIMNENQRTVKNIEVIHVCDKYFHAIIRDFGNLISLDELVAKVPGIKKMKQLLLYCTKCHIEKFVLTAAEVDELCRHVIFRSFQDSERFGIRVQDVHHVIEQVLPKNRDQAVQSHPSYVEWKKFCIRSHDQHKSSSCVKALTEAVKPSYDCQVNLSVINEIPGIELEKQLPQTKATETPAKQNETRTAMSPTAKGMQCQEIPPSSPPEHSNVNLALHQRVETIAVNSEGNLDHMSGCGDQSGIQQQPASSSPIAVDSRVFKYKGKKLHAFNKEVGELISVAEFYECILQICGQTPCVSYETFIKKLGRRGLLAESELTTQEIVFLQNNDSHPSDLLNRQEMISLTALDFAFVLGSSITKNKKKKKNNCPKTPNDVLKNCDRTSSCSNLSSHVVEQNSISTASVSCAIDQQGTGKSAEFSESNQNCQILRNMLNHSWQNEKAESRFFDGAFSETCITGVPEPISNEVNSGGGASANHLDEVIQDVLEQMRGHSSSDEALRSRLSSGKRRPVEIVDQSSPVKLPNCTFQPITVNSCTQLGDQITTNTAESAVHYPQALHFGMTACPETFPITNNTFLNEADVNSRNLSIASVLGKRLNDSEVTVGCVAKETNSSTCTKPGAARTRTLPDELIERLRNRQSTWSKLKSLLIEGGYKRKGRKRIAQPGQCVMVFGKSEFLVEVESFGRKTPRSSTPVETCMPQISITDVRSLQPGDCAYQPDMTAPFLGSPQPPGCVDQSAFYSNPMFANTDGTFMFQLAEPMVQPGYVVLCGNSDMMYGTVEPHVPSFINEGAVDVPDGQTPTKRKRCRKKKLDVFEGMLEGK